MVRDMVLEAIKPRDILEYYGIEEKRGRFLCPFHKDTNPSTSNSPSTHIALSSLHTFLKAQ